METILRDATADEPADVTRADLTDTNFTDADIASTRLISLVDQSDGHLAESRNLDRAFQ